MSTLTAAGIKSALVSSKASGKPTELYDQTGIGLRCRVYPSGAATFSLVMHGRRHQLGDALGGSIPEARQAAHRLRWQISQGHDPKAAREAARAAAAPPPKAGPTLLQVLETYELARAKVPNARTRSWGRTEARIRKIYGPLLSLPASQVNLAQLQDVADKHPSPRSLAPIWATLRGALRWASAGGRKLVSKDLLDVALDAKITPRERTLSHDEIRRIWPVLHAEHAAKPGQHASACLFLMLTGLRREEACGSTWRDVNLETGVLTIDKSRAKNGHEHALGLSKQAITVLHENRLAAGDVPDTALIFCRPGGKPLASWTAASAKIQAASGTAGWHRHDVRRTVATLLAELRVPPHLIDAVLAHTPPVLIRTYQRSDYRQERLEALQHLADHLDQIGGTNVVPIRAA